MLLPWLRSVFHWEHFYEYLQRQLQFFCCFVGLFCLFRVAFVVWMHAYIGQVSNADFAAAFLCGFRLSLKSAGVLTLVSAAAGFLCYLFAPRRQEAVQRFVGGLFIFCLTLLFCGRIPYYEQFHSGYNQLIFNTFHDDIYALAVSLTAQFQLPLRLLGALALAFVLYRLFVRCLRLRLPQLPRCSVRWGDWLLRGAFLALCYHAALFVNFGGSMSYAGNVDWENSGITRDQLLNEAILDDMQAIYRAYEINGRMESSTGLAFEARQIRGYAEALTGKYLENSASLDAYLEKKARGAPRQPRQVFLILSESYANWPLLSAYADLHLADGMKGIIARPDSAYADTFLPNGMSTISAVMGVVTGLADANLYLTTMPEAYERPYSTAIAPQLARLGYRTRFWYAGPTSWERVKDFSLAQGFDDFYGSGDYADASGNVWGCDDEILYKAVQAGIRPEEREFHLVLNVSNHSPFSVDVERAGFDAERLRRALPESARGDEELIRQLGHFWYADRQLALFIAAAREKCPDSLFLIVGDHADRVNVGKTPTMYERYGVPFVAVGAGVSKASFPAGVSGSHIDVPPTLIELIAPENFSYYAVGMSLTRGNRLGVNYGFWTADGCIGKTDAPFAPEVFKEGASPEEEDVRRCVEAVRAISWWRGKYGDSLIE